MEDNVNDSAKIGKKRVVSTFVSTVKMGNVTKLERLPDMGSFTMQSIACALTLDTRKWNIDDEDAHTRPLNVVVRVHYNRETKYLRTGIRCTMPDFADMCEIEKTAKGRGRNKLQRDEMKAHFEKVKRLCTELLDGDNFTMKHLAERYTGIEEISETLYEIWEKLVSEKREDGKHGTANSYCDALRRFRNDMGEHVKFTDIDHGFIEKWSKKMKKDISVTTCGIYLRTFRAIVNLCIKRGYVKGDTETLFKDTGYDKMASRKHEFLDVETWTRLYDFWKKGEMTDDCGKEMYPSRVKAALFRDLGLFLFMYLGNGQNLADTLRLRYDGWYFNTNRHQLRFYRHKTQARSEAESEVIFPILPEIKTIIERIGLPPKKDGRVFGVMSEYMSEQKEIECLHRYNANIRHHMKLVCDYLGIEAEPSPTWARHSFATNLSQIGNVPYKYIKDSMAHSSSGDVTSRYIGDYSYDKMVEYNSKLLNHKKKKTEKDDLMEKLRTLDTKKLKELLTALEPNED